jgi:hypothetical protein
VILSCFVTYISSIGGCRHLYYLTTQQQLLAVKYNWIAQIWGIVGFATGKVSVALLIFRIVGPGWAWMRWTLHFIMVSLLLFSGIDCILTFVQCNPPRALWTPDIPHKCWDSKIQSDYAIFVACMDLLLPMIILMLTVIRLERADGHRSGRFAGGDDLGH